MKKALITGITGQDGSYLADLLVAKGYSVSGMVRRTSSENLWRVHHLHDRIKLVFGDLLDQNSLIAALQQSEPDEVYNLAAQSFVPTSWNQPVLTGEFTGLGVTKMLEAVRVVNPKIRFFQASTSEMFGANGELPQNEHTQFHPRSPYGAAKAYGHYMTVNYRESYGMYACSGILFNHESPRRGLEFVTRKISYGAALVKLGLRRTLKLGNLEARRDWGYAPDYVEAMWRMLQRERADDYVVATGETHSVREFAARAFERLGLNWEDHVECDSSLIRPAEVDRLVGNASKASKVLGWKPRVRFRELVDLMVDADLDQVRSETERGGRTRARLSTI